MKVISVLNCKGGVGKTTFSACIGQALALIGFRVLAIDNDPQHNLSTMLGATVKRPTIRDVYHATTIGIGSQQLLKSARKTSIENLEVVPSSSELSVVDIRDPYILRKCFDFSSLKRSYDYVIIDNSPGMDILQETSIHASDQIFIPTELSQFAYDGIAEMEALEHRFNNECTITKIVPNFYRNIKAHDAFLSAFIERFPGKVAGTVIPFDSVFDTLVKEHKILFIHRLSSKAAAYYVKLVHELFGLNEQSTMESVMAKRTERLNSEATHRLSALRREAKSGPSAKNASVPDESLAPLNPFNPFDQT